MYGNFGSARGTSLLAAVVSTETTYAPFMFLSSVLVVRDEVADEVTYTLVVLPNGISDEANNECERSN